MHIIKKSKRTKRLIMKNANPAPTSPSLFQLPERTPSYTVAVSFAPHLHILR